jgi:hypothetical protein
MGEVGTAAAKAREKQRRWASLLNVPKMLLAADLRPLKSESSSKDSSCARLRCNPSVRNGAERQALANGRTGNESRGRARLLFFLSGSMLF